MRWQTALWILPLCLLNACFLSQTQPSQPQVQTPPVDGLITMEDVDTTSPSAGVFALFAEAAASSSLLSAVNGRFSSLASAAIQGPGLRALDCQVRHKTASPSTRAVASSTGLLDAGKLEFGPALQSTLEAVPHLEDGTYLKELSPGLAAGIYEFVAEGSREVPRFKDMLSFPEPLLDVKADSFLVKEGNLQLRQASGMQVTWKAPTVKNERNLVLIELRTQVEKNVDVLSCIIRETELGAGVTYTVAIPSTELRKVQHSSIARLDVLRAHVGKSQANKLTILTQGIRAVSGMGEVLEQ